VIFLAGLQSIPQEINESASVEGAGPIRRLVAITWPLLSNQVMLVAIVATITNVQVFDQIYVMTQGGPFFRTESIVTLVYRTGFTELDFGYASALSFVLLLLLLVLSLAQLAYFRGKAVNY
jgi:ABC-type sugar transport system permease subunit